MSSRCSWSQSVSRLLAVPWRCSCSPPTSLSLPEQEPPVYLVFGLFPSPFFSLSFPGRALYVKIPLQRHLPILDSSTLSVLPWRYSWALPAPPYISITSLVLAVLRRKLFQTVNLCACLLIVKPSSTETSSDSLSS